MSNPDLPARPTRDLPARPTRPAAGRPPHRPFPGKAPSGGSGNGLFPEKADGVSRRGLLVGAAGLAGLGTLAGCDPFGSSNAVPDPAEPHALDGLLAGTVALAGRYEAAISAVPALAPTLSPVQQTHRRHATVLAEAIGRPLPTASGPAEPASAGRAAAIAALATAEKAARDEAVTACLAASARLAALLGTIAAARASHLEILK